MKDRTLPAILFSKPQYLKRNHVKIEYGDFIIVMNHLQRNRLAKLMWKHKYLYLKSKGMSCVSFSYILRNIFKWKNSERI